MNVTRGSIHARTLLFAAMALSLTLAACAGLLGLKQTDSSHPFEHAAHINKGINCVVCHGAVATSIDKGPIDLPTDTTCRGCHSKPHDEHACNGCHGESHLREEAELARTHLRFQHVKHMGAVNGDCVRCHTDIALAKPEALLPKMASCFGCHEHKDQWALRDCNGCHVDLTTENTLPSSHLVHDGDWIREHGVRAASERDLCSSCHTERSCADCHGVGTVPALPAKLAFDDTRLPGLHRAGFRARHAEESRADPGICTTCHSESSCNECHTSLHVAGANSLSPHPQGWITTRGGGHGLQARVDPASCAGCHSGAGEQLCVGCHRVGGSGGNPHGAGFSSRKNKTHDLPCRMCHGTG